MANVDAKVANLDSKTMNMEDRIDALVNKVNTLKSQLTTLQNTVNTLQGNVTTLTNQTAFARSISRMNAQSDSTSSGELADKYNYHLYNHRSHGTMS